MRAMGEGAAASATELIVATSDGKEFILSKKSLRLSKLVDDLMAGMEDEDDFKIPLPNVSSEVLEAIALYLEEYEEKNPEVPEKPLRAQLKLLLTDWENDYIFGKLLPGGDEAKNELLIKVLHAANYMNIESLRDLCCATLASILRGKTPDEVLKTFGSSEKWGPEVEEKGLNHCPWLKDTLAGNEEGS